MDKAFKKIKKTIEQCFSAPTILNRALGILGVCENGIFNDENQFFSKLYRFECKSLQVDVYYLMKSLRDLDLCIEFIRISIDELYLCVLSYKNTFNDAIHDFHEIENKIQQVLESMEINVKALDFNERMSINHRILTMKHPDSNNGMINYFENVQSWSKDFTLCNTFEIKRNKAFMSNNKFYKACFIKSFSNKENKIIMDYLLNCNNVSLIKSCMQPISDQALSLKYKYVYLDNDARLHRIKNNDNNLYEILTGISKTDSKTFSLLSVSFLLEADTYDDIEKLFIEIQSLFHKHGCYLDYRYGSSMIEAFINIVPGCRSFMNVFRICKSILSCFIVPMISNSSDKSHMLSEVNIEESNNYVMNNLDENKETEYNNIFDNLIV